jgi:hypothetical protein
MIRPKDTELNHLISNLALGNTLALTAPLVTDKNVLIGYAVATDENYCATIPINEFISICNSIYFQVNTPRIFHGLKRIWEFLDDRGLHTDTDRRNYLDINNITDTKLLAYLLDPDSARPQADDNDEDFRGLVGRLRPLTMGLLGPMLIY